MTNCALETPLSRPHHAPDWERLLPCDRAELLRGWARRVHHSVRATDQNLGHLEEELLHDGHELFRQMLEAAVQQKADAAPPLCPPCQNKLSRLTAGHATTEKTTKAERAPVITAFINKNTGGVNATITPGGIGQIVGEELKLDPAKAADGIYFVPATGSATKVTVISTRTEGELLFLCPTLAAGTWHVEVRRTYGTATPVVRTGELSAALTVA